MRNSRSLKDLFKAWRKGEEIDIEIEIPFETVVFVLVSLIVIILWMVLK